MSQSRCSSAGVRIHKWSQVVHLDHVHICTMGIFDIGKDTPMISRNLASCMICARQMSLLWSLSLFSTSLSCRDLS
jgi:hypothetical protein